MPWGRLDDTLYDHPKLDEIPVEHRLAALGLWARSISWCNRYLTDGHVPHGRIEKLDGTAELAEYLVVAELFDRNGSGYVIHDFLDFNDSRETIEERRKNEAKRKAEWRANRVSRQSPSGTSRLDDPNVPPSVPDLSQRDTGDVSRRLSRRDTRARDVARDVARIPTRPVPSRPTESLDEENRGRARAKADSRPDVEALHAAGWKRVTKAQRAILDEIASRHDETGFTFAAQAIEAAPEGADPLAAAMDADRYWQAAQRRRADAEGKAWEETKSTERADAEARFGERPDWAGGSS